MYTIVGLGNPGDEYKNTRHNVGWIVLEGVLNKAGLSSGVQSGAYSGQLTEGILHGSEVGVLLPTTYMNNSGTAVAKYIKDRGNIGELIVVHDEVDLPLGEVKISYDRGPGGHNGVKSIIDACGSKEFTRIRIGIAEKGFFGGIKRPKGEKLSKFVLAQFKGREQKMLEEIIAKTDKAIELILQKGVQSAMQECNNK